MTTREIPVTVFPMRPRNNSEYTFGWDPVLPVELPLENGKIYTVTRMAVSSETSDTGSSSDDTTSVKESSASGCGGSVFAGCGAMVALLGIAGVALCRKKKENR